MTAVESSTVTTVGAVMVAYLGILRVKMRGKLGLAAQSGPLLRILVASVPAAAAAMGICRSGHWSEGPAVVRNWAILAAAGLAASAVYFFLAWTLGVGRTAKS